MVKRIFIDSSKLLPSYVPEELPYRESALNELETSFTNSMKENGFEVLQIVGDVGTGKTVTMLRFAQNTISKYGKRAAIRYAYINPRQHGSTRIMIFRQMAYQLAPEAYSTSLSAEELLFETLQTLERLNVRGIVLLDEIDFAIKKSQEPIIYNITRLNESKPSGAIMIPTVVISARTMSFRDKLDKAELSSLGNRIMFFERYNSEQVFKILSTRAASSINPSAYNENIIRYIAEITAHPPINGDIRYALDVLYNAGRLAESRGSESITIEHIRTVISITTPSITQEDIELLSPELRLALLSVTRALLMEKENYTSIDKIVKMQKEICNEMGIKEMDLTDFVKAIQELDDRGLIDVKGVARIGISGAPLHNLDDFLTYLISRLNFHGK